MLGISGISQIPWRSKCLGVFVRPIQSSAEMRQATGTCSQLDANLLGSLGALISVRYMGPELKILKIRELDASPLVGGDWNMAGLWLSIYIGNVIIPTDELHDFSEGLNRNHQPIFLEILFLYRRVGELSGYQLNIRKSEADRPRFTVGCTASVGGSRGVFGTEESFPPNTNPPQIINTPQVVFIIGGYLLLGFPLILNLKP